jgi:hypothetical protein
MKKINKADYFVGVFVSTILSSAKRVPALFDEPNESKRVEFLTNLGYFNVYIKYLTQRGESTYFEKGKEKIKYTCNINFGDAEYRKLLDFCKDGYKNYIVIIWTNESLTSTWIVVLDYKKAMKCLNSTTENGYRKIKITRYGGGHIFYCQGVSYKDNEFEKCDFDYSSYFEESPDKEAEVVAELETE